MRNRLVGILVVGIALIIGFIIFSFNQAMTTIVNTSCEHGVTCPMWGTISFQTNMSVVIMAVVIAIGLYLIFFGQEEKIITRIRKISLQAEPRRISKESYRKVMETLGKEEKGVLLKLIESQGSLYQSDLVSGDMTKVKVTRILDKLEGRGIIERRRRGMTNIVMLKGQ